MIVIIDYGLGNPKSIKNILKKLGFRSTISSDLGIIDSAEKLILPGVGHFERGMENLSKMNLIPSLNKKVLEDQTPVLGICLGMQLMTKHSEEGNKSGLGWIDASVKKFKFTDSKLKVPNMGWNTVDFVAVSNYHDIYHGVHPKFYFVHSYYVDCEDTDDILGTSNYGINYTSAFQKNNILGTQFHPEKSHKFGMALLKSFANS